MDNNFVKVGKWGSCLWGIDKTGSLFINEGEAESLAYLGSPWAESASSITSVSTTGTVSFPDGASLAELFKGCKNLEKGDLSGFVTDNVTDMRSMFEGCGKLKELDLSSFDTRCCSDMQRMFSQCAALGEILMGPDFSLTGDGTTSCDRLAVKEYGKYKKGKTISVEGFRVFYHSNLDDDRVEERQTVPNFRYLIEEPMYSAPSERSAFLSWNTEPDASGKFYTPGKAVDSVDEDLHLFAVWAYAPEIMEVAQPRSFVFGEPIPFEIPEIISVNDPEVTGYLEISKTGEEGTWHAIDHNAILPVSFNGYLIRLHAENSIGESVSNAVKLNIKRATIDTSSVRWAESSNMVYDGTPKEVHVEGLPAGIEPRYEDNIAIEAGTYVASFMFDFDQDNFNEPLVIRQHEWTIRKATLDMSEVRWVYYGSYDYDGQEKEVRLTGLPEGVTATYQNNKAANAGVYTATAILSYDSRNFEKPADIMPCVWEIKRAVIDPSSLRWSGYSDFVYDGTEKAVRITNLPEDVDVEYDGTEETLAGKYLARANLVGNYRSSGPVEYEWEVRKASYDLSCVRWDSSGEFVYDGAVHGIVLENVPEVLTVKYTGNHGTDAGSYDAVAYFINPDTHNYMTPENMTRSWEIKKKTVDMSGVHWNYEGSFTYDGEVKSVQLIGLPAEIKAEYENNSAFGAGSYNAHAVLKYDKANLEVAPPADCQWKINKRRIDVSEMHWGYKDAPAYNGKTQGVYLINVPEGLSIEYTDNEKVNSGKYVASATLIPNDPANFETPEINGCTWAIDKAELSIMVPEWTDHSSFVYDGKEKSVGIISDIGDALNVSYEDNIGVNAGRYYSRAIFSAVDDSNFTAPKPIGYSWVIRKASYDLSGVVWDYDSPFTYDGNPKSVKLKGVPEGLIVTYKDAYATDAGDYLAVAKFDVQDSVNYEDNIPDMTLDWSIRKASYDLSGVRWQGDRETKYDGIEKSMRLTGLPEGLLPVYSDNVAMNAGEYTARAGFEFDGKNYEKPEISPCRWIIDKSSVDISGVTWDYDKSFVYDGREKSVQLEGLPGGTRAEYSNASAVQAGTYVASAEIIPDDTANLLRSKPENLTWRIERGNYDMSHAYWDYDKAFTYDGTEHRVVLKGLPEGVIPSYHGNAATDAGNYRATVSFAVSDERNFKVPTFSELEWSIGKADYDISGASWNYEGEFCYTSRMYEVTLRGLPEGVRVVYSGNAAADTGTYEASADLIPYDADNYNKPHIGNCKWSIVKADYDMSAVRWDYSDVKIYNGRQQSVLLEHLPNGVTAEYSDNEAVDVGTYSAKAKLHVSDPDNYNVPSVRGCDWEICRAEYNMSRVSWDFVPGRFIYDGSDKVVELRDLPAGVCASYKGNTAAYAGSYTATAVFSTSDNNYNAPPEMSIDWSIGRADYDMSGVYWDYRDSFTYDGSPKRVELKGLPDGLRVEYSDNTATDAGTYKAVAHFWSDTDDYNAPAERSCIWMIDKADIDIRRLRWDYSQRLMYDGKEKTVKLEGLPELLTAKYRNNCKTGAGVYTAHADLMPVNPDNYNTPSVTDLNWEISKAYYDMSKARWDGGVEFEYDGEAKSVYITGLPDGVEPVYAGNVERLAGEHKASVEFICDTDNFNQVYMPDYSWSIVRTNYDMSSVSWVMKGSDAYDGTVKRMELTGLPDGVKPVYSGNEAVDAGDYEASVWFKYDEINYNKPVFGSTRWHIDLGVPEVDLSEVRWDYDGPFVYDGGTKSVALAEEVQEVGLFDRLRGKVEEVALAGIPEGFDVVYEGTTAVNAGIYYAKAKLICKDSDNYKELELPELKWEIVKAVPDMSAVRWDYAGAFVYDGQEKSVKLVGLPDTVIARYTDNVGTDAGEYEALVSFDVSDPANYEVPGPVGGCWWQINKAVYDMSEARWNYDDNIVYNGKEKTVRVTGLPEGVKVESYVGNKGLEAGHYTAEAILKYTNKANYERPSVPALKWRIQKKKVDLSEVVWNYDESTLFVYDDKPKEVKLAGLPSDVDVIYIDNSKINAGTYTARARLVFDTRNLDVDSIPDCRWKIEKAVLDTTDAHWSYEGPFRYDGSEKSISLRNVPNQISIRYRDNRASAIGSYTAKAYLTYDSDNYEAPELDTTIDWAIIGKEID